MAAIGAILAILDSRSFSTIWFWLLLASCWTWAGRSVLGVPADIIHRARGASPDDRDTRALALLDWLSLMLPRWQILPREGAVLFGGAVFGLVILMLLGFHYGLEMAQALFVLLAPLGVVVILRFRLAARLTILLAQARAGQLPPDEAARQAAAPMRQHRFIVSALSILVIILAAYWGALWLLARPFGF